MDEQLNNATDEPTTGRQHFRLDKHRARILATLQDRVWRSTMLLELCRSAFSRINQILFPTGPQPQGIHALLGLFRSAGPIRDFITLKLVDGANATMAYIRSQRPHMQLRPPVPGSTLSQSHLDDTVDHATATRSIQERADVAAYLDAGFGCMPLLRWLHPQASG